MKVYCRGEVEVSVTPVQSPELQGLIDHCRPLAYEVSLKVRPDASQGRLPQEFSLHGMVTPVNDHSSSLRPLFQKPQCLLALADAVRLACEYEAVLTKRVVELERENVELRAGLRPRPPAADEGAFDEERYKAFLLNSYAGKLGEMNLRADDGVPDPDVTVGGAHESDRGPGKAGEQGLGQAEGPR